MSKNLEELLGDSAPNVEKSSKDYLREEMERGRALIAQGTLESCIEALQRCPFFLLAEAHGLVRSENRSDYPHLDDEAFANFRNVATTGIAPGVLYRSSSPFWTVVHRDDAVHQAAERASIHTVIDIAEDWEKLAPRLEGDTRYCARQDIFARHMTMFFCDPEQEALFADLIRFLISHDGPYLIHCNEGQDRTGYVCGVLECFMGASLEEVLEDYLTTFRNYYGIEEGSLAFQSLSIFFCNQLQDAFQVEDVATADLAACARAFLSRIGLTDLELDSLRARLQG